MNIRSFAVADLDGVLGIQAAAPEAAQWRAEDYRSFSGDAQTVFLVCQADEDRSIAGFVIFYRVLDEAELRNLAVGRRDRRNGIGRRLLAAGIDRLRAAGVKRLFCEVRASNVAALVLYQGAGFKRQSVRPKYYANPSEDAVLLALDLAPLANATSGK